MERYHFGRGELEIINSQIEQARRINDFPGLAVWCSHLTQMVDKLYNEVATLKHELGQLKDRVIGNEDGCERCPHGVPLESYEGCGQCDPELS